MTTTLDGYALGVVDERISQLSQGFWILYTRQSSAKLKSLKEQEAEGRRDLARKGVSDPHVMTDKVSASEHTEKVRDGWPAVQAQIESGEAAGIWLWEVSRADRIAADGLLFLALCKKHNVLIRVGSHGRTYDMENRRDWKTLADEFIDAQDEVLRMSERLRRATASSAEEGDPTTLCPFGYCRKYDERTRKLVKQLPDFEPRTVAETGETWSPAAIIVEIFHRLYKGEGAYAIAEDLNARKLPTPRQLLAVERPNAEAPADRWATSRWTHTGIRAIVRNVSYKGLRWSKRSGVRPAKWVPLVSDEVWTTVQAGYGTRTRLRAVADPHLASGIGTCGNCGALIGWGGVGLNGVGRYTCRGKSPKGRFCASAPADVFMAYYGRNDWRRESGVNQLIAIWAIGYLTQPGLITHLQRQVGNKTVVAAAVRAGDLQSRLDKWEAALNDPAVDIDPAAWSKRHKELKRALAKAKAEALQGDALAFDLIDEFQQDPERGEDIWFGMQVAVQRRLITGLIDLRIFPCGRGSRRPLDKERLIIKARYPYTAPEQIGARA